MEALQTKSFFGETGLTSTRANQISELASLYADKAKSELSNLKFYSEHMHIPGQERILIKQGTSKEELDQVINLLKDVTDCNSLIAFFREAIKEKDRLTKEAQAYRDDDAREKLAKRQQTIVKPVLAETITEEDVMQSWSIGEQEKFLSLQTKCSVYGKFIHKDGSFDTARKELLKKMKKPNVVNTDASQIIVTEYTPSIDFEYVDTVFQSLQSTWRDLQGELNGMKKQIEDAIKADELAKRQDYEKDWAKYSRNMRVIDDEYEQIQLKEQQIQKEMLENIQNLKIVIPHRLQSIYEKLIK